MVQMSRLRVALILGAALLALVFSVLIGQESPKSPGPRPTSEVFNEFGRIVRLDLDAAPFPDTARQAGYSYEGEFFPRDGHYDDSTVAVFIPKNFKPRGKVDLVFFFHGWYSSISEAAQEFDLFRQFSASGEKALLVMPETARDAPDSFAGKLERENGFQALEAELLDALGAAGIASGLKTGRIILMGHIGAYHVISRILAQKGIAPRVSEVLPLRRPLRGRRSICRLDQRRRRPLRVDLRPGRRPGRQLARPRGLATRRRDRVHDGERRPAGGRPSPRQKSRVALQPLRSRRAHQSGGRVQANTSGSQLDHVE